MSAAMTASTACPHCRIDLRVAILSRMDSNGRLYVGGLDAEGQPITTADVHVHDADGKPLYGSSVVSVEDPDIYDGHLYWMCPFCNGVWHNWPKSHRLRAAAEERMNAMRAMERQ